MSESIETLGPKREARLKQLEVQIEDGLTAFVRLGEALIEIRADSLYRAKYNTFAEYCEGRWEISRGHAYRLIEAAEVVRLIKEVSPKGDTPRKETHARALAPLKEQPAEMTEAWKDALAKTDGQPQASDVEEAVSARVASSPPASDPPTPDPGQTPASEPTPIQAAVRGSLPDNEGTFHLSTGQLERMLTLSEADDNGIVRVQPTGREAQEIEVAWRANGERKRCALNRHGNSPPAEGGTSAVA